MWLWPDRNSVSLTENWLKGCRNGLQPCRNWLAVSWNGLRPAIPGYSRAVPGYSKAETGCKTSLRKWYCGIMTLISLPSWRLAKSPPHTIISRYKLRTHARGGPGFRGYAEVLSRQHFAMGIPRAEDVHIPSC